MMIGPSDSDQPLVCESQHFEAGQQSFPSGGKGSRGRFRRFAKLSCGATRSVTLEAESRRLLFGSIFRPIEKILVRFDLVNAFAAIHFDHCGLFRTRIFGLQCSWIGFH